MHSNLVHCDLGSKIKTIKKKLKTNEDISIKSQWDQLENWLYYVYNTEKRKRLNVSGKIITGSPR